MNYFIVICEEVYNVNTTYMCSIFFEDLRQNLFVLVTQVLIELIVKLFVLSYCSDYLVNQLIRAIL